jgi:hypothetical protein
MSSFVMVIEQALSTIEEILNDTHLSQTQELILRQIWQGCSYQEIAKRCGYTEGYVRSVGAKLFQTMAKRLGEKVSKQNIQFVLKRYLKRRSSMVNPSPNGVSAEWLYRKHASDKVAASTLPVAAQPAITIHPVAPPLPGLAADPTPTPIAAQQDWGDAMDVSAFYGREPEFAQLQPWILDDRCRLIGLTGPAGIGKTALSVALAQRVQTGFERVIWRSLRYPPPLPDLLAALIQFLDPSFQSACLPATLGDRLFCLIQSLRQTRSLIVLDDWPTLQSGHASRVQPTFGAGSYPASAADYGELLQRLGETQHQSCVIITSSRAPREAAILQGALLPVRTLAMSGLDDFACQKLLYAKGLFGSRADLEQLIAFCQGNPLELKLAATTIQDLFGGKISAYLQAA